MKINVAQSAGFCFGVRRALTIAHETAQTHKHVYMLGDIVHNEEVIAQIEKLGIQKIASLSDGKGKTLLIRAHGSSIKTKNKARRLGYAIVDATCPMVKEIHSIAKEMENRGYAVIVIGDKKHDEVKGIIGQLKGKSFVIDDLKRLPARKLSGLAKAAVVVQSTQNQEKVEAIVSRLQSHIRRLKFFNTICLPTRTKQRELKSLPLENDLILVIGSKTSANTRRLYEISKSLNKKTYWVRTKTDIKPKWFRGIKKVGITSGASTPDSTTRDVITRIRELARKKKLTASWNQ